MEPRISPRGALTRNAKVGAGFGIVLGFLVIAVVIFPTPSGTAAEQLANFNAGAWEVIGVLDVLILLVAIPFAAYLRSVLEARSPGTASAAAILFVVGVVFAAGASLIQAISMSTLSSMYTSASSSAADRAAAVLITTLLTGISSNLFPIILLEAGIVLFSFAMVNSGIVANWVADAGVASALLTVVILGLSPFVSSTSLVGFLLFIALLVLLVVWIFATSAYLLRSARAVAVGAPAPA